jgi:ABC-type uncharacterized transport system permease subunit
MIADASAGTIAAGIFIFLCVFNFLPSMVAYVDRHPDRHLLATINVMALFSFALWIALMGWAVAGKSDHPLIARFVGSPRQRRRLVASVLALVMAGSAGTAWALAVV